MNIAVEKPEHEKYIHDQLQAGRFPSAEQLVAAALEQFIRGDALAGDDEIDDATAARLTRAYERGARGDGGTTIEEARKRLLGHGTGGPPEITT